MSVPDWGEGVLTVLDSLKVPQKPTQGLPRPMLRVCRVCSSEVQTYPTIKCPKHGFIDAATVMSIRKD